MTGATTAALNLRDKPTVSGSTVLLTIPKGTVLGLTERQGSWYRTTHNGTTGWVFGAYLANLTEAAPEVIPGEATESVWTPDCRQVLYDVIKDQLGKPYDWGGSNAIDGAEAVEGQDCSGFTTICLQSQDVLGEQERLSAQSQYARWKSRTVKRSEVQFGDLIFYGSSVTNIGHVMLALNDTLCVGAQGGGQLTKTLADAVKTRGYVRTRTIDYRGDRVAIVRPPWPFHE